MDRENGPRQAHAMNRRLGFEATDASGNKLFAYEASLRRQRVAAGFSNHRSVTTWTPENIRLELYAMASFAIAVSWYNFVDYYPLVTKTTVATKTGTKISVALKDPRGSLNGELDGWATENINENPKYTTCCIQMSHAINMAFVNTDVSKMVGAHSVRRNTHSATIARAGNREFHYLAAVDEMKAFLDETFEAGRKISSRKDIDDQPGIVVFMGTSPWGVHTEIWLGDNFHQTFMKNNFASLKMPNVWFWSLGDPTLVDI